MDRRAQIASNLAAVRERIAAACVASGRSPSEITLIAVTKTYPSSDVVELLRLGVRDIGENRDQEAAPKALEVGPGPLWHFIGQLQRNKCKSVVTYAGMVHSVDSVELADPRRPGFETAGGAARRAGPGEFGRRPAPGRRARRRLYVSGGNHRLCRIVATAGVDGCSPSGGASRNGFR